MRSEQKLALPTPTYGSSSGPSVNLAPNPMTPITPMYKKNQHEMTKANHSVPRVGLPVSRGWVASLGPLPAEADTNSCPVLASASASQLLTQDSRPCRPKTP